MQLLRRDGRRPAGHDEARGRARGSGAYAWEGERLERKRKKTRQVGHPAFTYREHEPINYAGDDRTLLPCEGWDIVEWHPLPNGEGAATQVHIIITPSGPLDELKFIMRLKSKAACDAMIETLQRHRDSVWGVS